MYDAASSPVCAARPDEPFRPGPAVVATCPVWSPPGHLYSPIPDEYAPGSGTVVRMQRYEYRVLQIRESMIGGKLSPDKLERTLNDEARDGWQLRAITSTEVKGRVGPGGVEGLLITFERPVRGG